MGTISDDKLAALLFANGNASGSVNDQWSIWLKSQIVGPTAGKETINDLENLFLDEAGVSDGTQNDRWFIWLGTEGHLQGSIQDRWASYWADVAP